MNISFKVFSEPYFIPAYSHEGDGAADLFAAVELTLEPFERRAVGTGIAIEIPNGYGGLILPRSGAALKNGITVVNAPGLIDSGYRGELMIALVNLSPLEQFTINLGDRVAQLLIVELPRFTFERVDELSPTVRGEGGFGSTGSSRRLPAR